jgi:hypothetical protein
MKKKINYSIEYLVFSLPILVFIGSIIQFMALDIDSISVVNDDRSFLEVMADWWSVHGVNRFLGQGAFVALYQLPDILTQYTLAPLLALTSRLLVVIVAIRMMGGKVKDCAWLLGLILVTPFWMDPALLFARAVNELISALIFFFVFRKHADQIGVMRIFLFFVLQVLFYEALLIPVLALIWFVKHEERRVLYKASTLFGVLYFVATMLGILSSSKFVTSIQSEGVVIKSDGVSTYMPYAGKLTQLINSVQAITPTILLISLIVASVMGYLISKLWSQVDFKEQNPGEVIKISQRRWIELFLAITAPVFVNWVISLMVGNHGRVYWIMLSYSWLLFVLLSYSLGLHMRYKKASVILISFIFFFSTILVLDLHTDLSNQDINGFSGKFFRGFTSHFGFH